MICILHCIHGTCVVLSTAVGITNQRETTVVWDKETGVPLSNAIGMPSLIVHNCKFLIDFSCMLYNMFK